VVNVPEFLREGTAIADFEEAPFMVVGTDSERAFEVVSGLFDTVGGPPRRADIAATEVLKVVNNAWHALKVSFANEVGAVCKGLGIDSHAVMGLFRADRKLNLSGCYLQPGFAYGGSCLPKDLAALAALGRAQGLELPVIQAIERSNASVKKRVIDAVAARGCGRVGIVGLSFKAGTDDMRNSPMVEVAEGILAQGMEVRIYDRGVRFSEMEEASRSYLVDRIPGIADYVLADLGALVETCGLIVVAARESALNELLPTYPDKYIVDLVRLDRDLERHPGGYYGIAW